MPHGWRGWRPNAIAPLGYTSVTLRWRRCGRLAFLRPTPKRLHLRGRAGPSCHTSSNMRHAIRHQERIRGETSSMTRMCTPCRAVQESTPSRQRADPGLAAQRRSGAHEGLPTLRPGGRQPIERRDATPAMPGRATLWSRSCVSCV